MFLLYKEKINKAYCRDNHSFEFVMSFIVSITFYVLPLNKENVKSLITSIWGKNTWCNKTKLTNAIEGNCFTRQIILKISFHPLEVGLSLHNQKVSGGSNN